MKSRIQSIKTIGAGGSTPQGSALESCEAIYTFIHSTPAKPLPRMLNSGGFFFFEGCPQ